MYISLSERPRTNQTQAPIRRPRVAGTVVLLGFVSLLTDVSSESVAAILPLYLTTVVGLSPVAFGLVDALQQGVSAFVRLGGGWLADRTDRPKPVAFAGYALSALARVFLLFASTAGAIAAVVSADRIGKGIRTAPRDAMIAEASDPEHLGHAFGVHRALDTLGAAIGPLLAFWILWVVPDGYRTVMVVSLAFAVLGVALLGLLVPSVRGTARAARPRTDEDAVRTPTPPPFRMRDLTDSRLRPLLLVAGALGLLTVGDAFLYLVLMDRGGFAATWFPLLYVGTNVAYLLLAIPMGRLADRWGRARVFLIGHVALFVAYASALLPTAALGGSLGATLSTLALLGVFYAATDGVIAALASRLVPQRARTSGIAAAQTVVAVARMVASAGFGVAWLWVGPQVALGGVAVVLGLVVALCTPSARRLDNPLRETA